MKHIKGNTIEEFLNELGSANPTPGGGVVASLLLGQANSLIRMIASIVVSKKKYEDIREELNQIINGCVTRQNKLLSLAQDDQIYFLKLLDTFKTKDKKKIEDATIECAKAPLAAYRLVDELFPIAERMKELSTSHLMSDVKIIFILLDAAKKSAYENVMINLNSIKETEFYRNVIGEISKMF